MGATAIDEKLVASGVAQIVRKNDTLQLIRMQATPSLLPRDK